MNSVQEKTGICSRCGEAAPDDTICTPCWGKEPFSPQEMMRRVRRLQHEGKMPSFEQAATALLAATESGKRPS